MRPRTLPLALASIAMGGFLAGEAGAFDPAIVALAALTTLFLQILSNLANDYGDTIHGADHAGRTGPARAVQSGAISAAAMRRAMGVSAGLAMVSGVALLWLAFGRERLPALLLFLLLGGAAIVAAITYTAGKRPYGYVGLGDLFVFLFFGLVGVLGTFVLQTGEIFGRYPLLPAIACGLLATAVLNVNNLRDIRSDQVAGKRSLPVRLGERRGRLYHWALIGAALVAALGYNVLTWRSGWQLLWLPVGALLIGHALAVWRTPAGALDPHLRRLALLNLLFVLLFGLGLMAAGRY
jgi:1,4-dihydroxy-2-naphthoate octaprenyltransferase